MKYAKIIDNIVVGIHLRSAAGLVEVPDNVYCGMIQNPNGTFSTPTPTQEQLMDRVRFKRNQLLTQTDWRMTTDYPYNDQAAWASYRTQLRNLPQTANPTLDENGNLIVDWPQAPDNV